MRPRAFLPAFLFIAVVIGTSPVAHAAGVAAPSGSASSPDVPFTPSDVLASLSQALTWYREARVAMQATSAVFAPQDEQTALAVLQRAFDTARAEAAVLNVDKGPTPAPRPAEAQKAEKRAQADAAIQTDQHDIEALRTRLRSAPARQRPSIRDQLAAATNRLELDRARLDFLAKLEPFDISSSGVDADLAHQIQALQDSVLPNAAASEMSGTWGLVRRLIALEHTRTTLVQLEQSTSVLDRSINRPLSATQASVRPIIARLRALTTDPTGGGSLTEGQETFQALLERTKLLAGVVVSLREESALVRRFAGDLEAWKGAVDRNVRQALQSLAIGLIGVVVATAAILVGATLWRVAAMRYVHDASRRRLVMIARNVVVVTALSLVLVVHFASGLTTLVTGLGFAAAGVAFALQNVILALAGYFSMVAPNGIRIGDHVSLQGPFGYVQGEVLDIGFVRIRLRELAGDPLRPTGRIVVFPNSVVFTGSFFKHPATDSAADRPRRIDPGAAA
jgi:Mechanosensitive ion channel